MSAINTNSIDINYPVPGINNSTQGFRDNFTSVKNNLDTAGNEITDLQNKVVVKTALTGTVLNNDMANTLISNASVQGFRAKTYNLGDNLPGTVLIDVTKADVQYGTITQNTVVTFGGWAPSGTQSNVEIIFNIANASAFITFPSTVVNNNGNITNGMGASMRLLENYYSNVTDSNVTANLTYTNVISVPTKARSLDLKFITTDCGTTVDVQPINRNQKATQIPIRQPLAIGLQGDAPGQVCTDGAYLYVCVGTYNGTSSIWGKVALTAV
jgi:hypothetical protein